MQLLSQAPIRRLILVGMVARLPHSAAGLIITLHVVTTLGLGYGAAGLVVAVLTVGIAIGSPWRGRMIDRIGLRRTLVPSVIAEAVLWPLAAFVPYPVLIVVSFVGGVFALPIFTVMRQSLSVIVPESQRRTVYALDSISTELVFIIGPAAGVLIATTASTQLALVVIGIAVGAAGVFLVWFNPATRSQSVGVTAPAAAAVELVSAHEVAETGEGVDDNPTPRVPGIRSRFGWLTPAIAGILAASIGATLSLAGTDVGILAQLRAHGAVSSLGIVYFFWCAASIVGGLLYGALHKSINPLVLLIFLGLFTVPMAFAHDVVSLSLLSIPAGLLCAPVMTATGERIAALVPEHQRGEAMGWQGSAFTLGGAVGSPLAGAVIDHLGPWGGFTVVGLISAFIALLGLMAQTMHRHRRVSV